MKTKPENIKDFELGEIIDSPDSYVKLRAIKLYYQNGNSADGSIQCVYSGGGFYDTIVWETLELD